MSKRLLIYLVISHPVALFLIYICPLTATITLSTIRLEETHDFVILRF